MQTKPVMGILEFNTKSSLVGGFSMKFRNLVVAAAGACLLALTSFAQITAIEGDVKGEDGNPAVGAAVKIVRVDIKGTYPCKTNKKGHYFYNGLPLGTYNITVEINGKVMDVVNNVRTSLGDPKAVDFDLQKVAQRQKSEEHTSELQSLRHLVCRLLLAK